MFSHRNFHSTFLLEKKKDPEKKAWVYLNYASLKASLLEISLDTIVKLEIFGIFKQDFSVDITET